MNTHMSIVCEFSERMKFFMAKFEYTAPELWILHFSKAEQVKMDASNPDAGEDSEYGGDNESGGYPWGFN